MTSPSIRILLSLLVGALSGSTLGILFVPDPTGLVAFVLAVASTAIITWFLYQSAWLRS